MVDIRFYAKRDIDIHLNINRIIIPMKSLEKRHADAYNVIYHNLTP